MSVPSSRLDPQSDARQESTAGGIERIKAGGHAEAFVSQATSYLSGRRRGSCQGEGELAETRRWSCEESETGEKVEGESCWKSGGGRTRLYSWVADEARSDAMPEAALT